MAAIVLTWGLFTYYLFFKGVHEVATLSFGYFVPKPKVTAPAAIEREDDVTRINFSLSMCRDRHAAARDDAWRDHV